MSLSVQSVQRGAERSRPLVLFIEDNVTQLDLYTMVLEEAFDVVRATRGESGYREACHRHPDVIVIDVLLPDVDGLTLCTRLRANPNTAPIPVIVLTGDDGAYTRAQGLRSDFTGVLMKPCPGDRLLEAVRHALKRRV
jgi:two-component system response regulator MprA